MEGLARLLPLLLPASQAHPAPQQQRLADLAQRALLAMLRQAVERIGRMREAAASCLQQLLPAAQAAGVPLADELAAAVFGRAVEQFSELEALPAVAALLVHPGVQPALLEGLCFSIGGLDAQLSAAAGNALADAVQEQLQVQFGLGWAGQEWEPTTEQSAGLYDLLLGAHACVVRLIFVCAAILLAWLPHTHTPRTHTPCPLCPPAVVNPSGGPLPAGDTGQQPAGGVGAPPRRRPYVHPSAAGGRPAAEPHCTEGPAAAWLLLPWAGVGVLVCVCACVCWEGAGREFLPCLDAVLHSAMLCVLADCVWL